MLNSELVLLSKSFPKEFRHFDAHIYYDVQTREEALALREKARIAFQHQPVFVGRMIDYPIGPHPVPMFEINFQKSISSEIFHWLELHCKNFTVLIHEVTGDDHRDHSAGAMWLGTPLELDVSQFDPVNNSEAESSR